MAIIPEDKILYHAFYQENENVPFVSWESNGQLDALQHNSISDTFIKMYKEEIQKAMG